MTCGKVSTPAGLCHCSATARALSCRDRVALPAFVDHHGSMSKARKNANASRHQGGLFRPGEIERAAGRSGGDGFLSRSPSTPDRSGSLDPPALRFESLGGSAGLGQPRALSSERSKASDRAQPAAARRAVDASAPRILERQEIAPGLLRLRVERPSGFAFRAGQHVKFGLPGNRRSYTLVSAPHEPHLEFFIELLPGGRLSEPMRSVIEGAPTALGPAGKGSFVIDSSVSNHVFVATVTGIAPFVSILRDQVRQGFSAGRFLVLHGASYAEELGYADELKALAAAYPARIEYVPTVSRPTESRNQGWTGTTGRVDALFAPALRSRGLPAGDTAVYACGNSGMIRNVRAVAGRQRLPFHAEAFD